MHRHRRLVRRPAREPALHLSSTNYDKIARFNLNTLRIDAFVQIVRRDGLPVSERINTLVTGNVEKHPTPYHFSNRVLDTVFWLRRLR